MYTGEWWNDDVEQQGLAAGSSFRLADALTINGFPGTQYNCSGSEGKSMCVNLVVRILQHIMHLSVIE